MDWKDYKNWLLENVLEKKEGTNDYVLRPAVQEKYSLTNEEEIEKALNDFLSSVDRSPGDLTYYRLPEWEEGKTWEELFPERREIFFGVRKINGIPLRQEVWIQLSRLYNCWGTEAEREKSLREEANQLWSELKEEGEKIIKGMVGKANSEQTFLNRCQTWLQDYKLLGQKAQKSLNGYKGMIEEDENSLQQGLKGLSDQEEEKERWEKKMAEVWERIAFLTKKLEIIGAQEPISMIQVIFVSLLITLVLILIAGTIFLWDHGKILTYFLGGRGHSV